MLAEKLNSGSGGPVTYIEDVFSTYLYTGNGSTQTINNGIDLAGKGGMVWVKSRNAAYSASIVDTNRGATKVLVPSSTQAEYTQAQSISSFTTSGFSQGGSFNNNELDKTYASWTFRKQPKFFDVVTYTGNGAARTIAHNLGSKPGCIIVKCTSSSTVNGSSADWFVWHKGVYDTYGFGGLKLNTTGNYLSVNASYVFGSNDPATTTGFTLSGENLNWPGETYVAYLFAHNAGGFGLTGTDNVISCGSFTTDANGDATVNLGYEVQWLLTKTSTVTDNWTIEDNMRGMNPSNTGMLFANLSNAETSGNPWAPAEPYIDYPTATGFRAKRSASTTYIYIAIRRGPMKVPTDGTKVFSPIAANNSTGTVNTTGFPVDLQIATYRSGVDNRAVDDRLRGVSTTATESGQLLRANTTDSEVANYITRAWDNTGFQTSSGGYGGLSAIYWNFRRAPGFFDEVCWSGDGTGNPRNHNLTVYPELVISKLRSGGAGFGAWGVQNNINPSAKQTGVLNTTAAFSSSGATSPTANVFYPTDDQSGATYVTYLFASCPGVSKVGSYTGTGATQTINCGFTGGARFVLIKRADGTGNWYVWDTARGMVAGTDPKLALNSTAAETNANWVYTTTGGFQIVTSDATVNANGGSYIFLAVA